MNQIFLSLLKDARLNQKTKPLLVNYDELFQLSSQHQVIPLIYNQIYSFPDFPAELKEYWKRLALKENAIQAIKTDKFLKVYAQFLKHDLKVVVVKGLICRSLYPQPDNRPSNDEDLYVEKEAFEKASDILLQEGFQMIESGDDVTTFMNPVCGLTIELHTALFSKDSKAYGQYQDLFDDAFEHLVIHTIANTEIYSLSYDLHLLFLIMHFVKHFLHGGVGIRQVMDIVMYSETYGDKIDWPSIYQALANQNVLTLIENVFALAHQYLAFDYEKIVLPQDYQEDLYDYQDLLDDILDAGIFGKSSAERLHSSTITLNATVSGRTSIIKSVFPRAKDISGRYPYLKKYPFLLPIAWFHRLFHYLTNKKDGNKQKTIEIGAHRVELLKKYEVIK